jgi:hypothetical protein
MFAIAQKTAIPRLGPGVRRDDRIIDANTPANSPR